MRGALGLACRLVALALLSAGVAGAEPAVDLQAQVDAAIREGQKILRLPPGTVRLPAGLAINKANGLTIEGAPTTLICTDSNVTAIRAERCRGLTLRGITLDYDPLPFTQGTITSRSEDGLSFEFGVHDGYPSLTPDYLEKHIHLFDPQQPLWKREAPDYYPRQIEALDPRHGRLLFGTGARFLDRIAVGDRVVLNKRVGNAIKLAGCEDVRVEDVTVLAGPGCGLLARYMRGDNYFRFDIRPGPPPAGASQPRLMSTCADGFNYALATRGPVLERSHFSFMGDDSVNLHGAVLAFLEQVSPTEVLALWPYSPEQLTWIVNPGDPLRRLRPGSFARAGEAPIASLTPEAKPDAELLKRILAIWPRNPAGRGTLWRIRLAQPLAFEAGDFLDLPGTCAPGFRISGCGFSDHRARGLRIMASHGLIEGNTFRRLKQVAISLGPEYGFWREAGWVEDVTIRGNTIEDVGADPGTYASRSYTLGAISAFGRQDEFGGKWPFAPGNRGIVIEGNRITGCSVAGIYLRSAEDVSVKGNTLSRTNTAPASEAGAETGLDVREPIDVRGVSGARVEGNHVSNVGAAP